MDSLENIKQNLMNFLNLEKNNVFLILTDDDEDGLTSATQLKRFLVNHNKKVNVFFNEKRSILQEDTTESEFFKEFFDKTNPDLIIFLDLNESIAEKNLVKINTNIPVIIIDHHPSPKEINFNNPLFVLKPNLFSSIAPSKYSTTKLVFDFFDGINLEKNSLEAVVGLIGDSAFGEWESFVEDVLKENNISFEDATKISDIIKANYSIKGDKNELFDFVFENGIKNILGSKFEDNSIEFQELIKAETKRFDIDAERFDEIELVFFKTKKGLPSKLSNVLSKIHKQTLVIYAEDDFTKGSVRRNDFKLNCGGLIEFALGENKSVGSGGGHIPAGGFACLTDYFAEFKKRAIEYARNNLSKE